MDSILILHKVQNTANTKQTKVQQTAGTVWSETPSLSARTPRPPASHPGARPPRRDPRCTSGTRPAPARPIEAPTLLFGVLTLFFMVRTYSVYQYQGDFNDVHV